MMQTYLNFNKLILLLLVIAGFTATPAIGFNDLTNISSDTCVVKQSGDDDEDDEDPEC